MSPSRWARYFFFKSSLSSFSEKNDRFINYNSRFLNYNIFSSKKRRKKPVKKNYHAQFEEQALLMTMIYWVCKMSLKRLLFLDFKSVSFFAQNLSFIVILPKHNIMTTFVQKTTHFLISQIKAILISFGVVGI